MRRTAYHFDFLISRQPRPQVARLTPVTLVRIPAPNELEYLDVFDFFNVPRLPVHNGDVNNGRGNGTDTGTGVTAGMPVPDAAMAGKFNVTNFMVDANSD